MENKRKVIITGGSKGIGKSIAFKFAENKFDIYLLSSNKKNLQKVKNAIKKKFDVNILFCNANLKTQEGCNFAIKKIQSDFNDFDTIIFSAGDTKSGNFLTQPLEDYFDGFALKFFSVVRLLRAFWKILKRKKGWVVIINGAMAHTPDQNFMVGGAVNAALQNFSNALSKKGMIDNVNVNVINPGMTSTKRLNAIIRANAKRENTSFKIAKNNALLSSNLKRFSTPEEVAEVAYFICQKNVRHFNGNIINLDGGKKPTI